MAITHFPDGVWDNTEPSHQMQTRYKYNSLNQVTWQSTPDGGESNFWYDNNGMLRLSQNAKQEANSDQTGVNENEFIYSYTKYDEQGRIIEVGEMQDFDHDYTATDDISEAINDPTFPDPFVNILSDLTKNYYDKPATNASITQRQLPGRVSSSQVKATPGVVESATHYSYDAHGNVNLLEQQPYMLGSKVTGYDYDLVSGNVPQVKYQEGQLDQFFHRYCYDADNRLTKVQTSRDDVIWEEDARYFYYPHGPLARMELGEDNLQGVDYYYTIQGWLKGINEVGNDRSLDPAAAEVLDPGLDGFNNNIHENMGRDEFALALGYYNGDYEPIGPSGLDAAADPDWSTLSYVLEHSSNNEGLYNGNIAWMATDIQELGPNGQNTDVSLNQYQYQYDQLNRITAAHSQVFSSGTSLWEDRTGATGYLAEYQYDPNGNLKKLKRNDQSGGGLDDLVYNYLAVGGQISNRLGHVDELWPNSAYTDDLEDQAANNYTYDEVGNLIGDVAENIDLIEWTPQGKVKKIHRTSASGLPDIEFMYDPMGNRIAKILRHDYMIQLYNEFFLYSLDASGNILATYYQEQNENGTPSSCFDEVHFGPKSLKSLIVYGSSRLGMRDSEIDPNDCPHSVNWDQRQRVLGAKSYELTNHLGNVLASIDDSRFGEDFGTDGQLDYYRANVVTAQDYFPFGMPLHNRTKNIGVYTFGFNGQEYLNEVAGSGNHTTALFWEYNIRLARRWNIDPVVYAWQSGYSVNNNNPIWFTDPLGAEGESRTLKRAEKFAIKNDGILVQSDEGVQVAHFAEDGSVHITAFKESIIDKIANYMSDEEKMSFGSHKPLTLFGQKLIERDGHSWWDKPKFSSVKFVANAEVQTNVASNKIEISYEGRTADYETLQLTHTTILKTNNSEKLQAFVGLIFKLNHAQKTIAETPLSYNYGLFEVRYSPIGDEIRLGAKISMTTKSTGLKPPKQNPEWKIEGRSKAIENVIWKVDD